jgi:hypothetical protein
MSKNRSVGFIIFLISIGYSLSNHSAEIERADDLQFTYHRDFREYGDQVPAFQFYFPKRMVTKAVEAFKENEDLKNYYSGHSMLVTLGEQEFQFDCEYQYAYVDRFNARFTYVEYICVNEKRYGFFVRVRGDVLTEESSRSTRDFIALSSLVYPGSTVDDKNIEQLNSILDQHNAYKLIPLNWSLDQQKRTGTVLRPVRIRARN